MKAATRTKAIVLAVTIDPWACSGCSLPAPGCSRRVVETEAVTPLGQIPRRARPKQRRWSSSAKSCVSSWGHILSRATPRSRRRSRWPATTSLAPLRSIPVASNLTHLRWFPQFDRPFSETHYDVPAAETHARSSVDVKPSYFYYQGDKGATDGEPMTVGGKAGWMLTEDDIGCVFVFHCGSVDDVKVWCQVIGGQGDWLGGL